MIFRLSQIAICLWSGAILCGCQETIINPPDGDPIPEDIEAFPRSIRVGPAGLLHRVWLDFPEYREEYTLEEDSPGSVDECILLEINGQSVL